MNTTAALGATATLIALAFASVTGERWLDRGRTHDKAWTISFLMFALGSFGFWAGSGWGWSSWSFRMFYLFGAILNVPYLAAGTLSLLRGPVVGERVVKTLNLLAAFAGGILLVAPLRGPLHDDVFPSGRELFGVGPRVFAAVGSGVGATIVFGGALWSAVSLLRSRTRPASDVRLLAPGRLALTNFFIAAGTLILSLSGTFATDAAGQNLFALTLVAGISTLFVGFLLSSEPTQKQPAQ